MKKTGVMGLVLSAGAVLVLTAGAWADSVWISSADRPNDSKGAAEYKGKIDDIKMAGGQATLVLIWETSSQPKAFPMIRVRRVAVDEVPELGTADAAYGEGKFMEAIRQYGSLQGKSPRPWIGPYVNFRLVDCFAQTKQFARSVKALVDLCRANSPLAEAVKLPAVMAKGSKDNEAAAKTLDEALAAKPPIAHAEKLKRLRMNILMVEGNPTEVLQVVEGELKNPDEDLRSQARIKQVELLLALGKLDEASKAIALGHRELDAEYGPPLFFYEGRVLYEKKDFLHAAMAFMRTPILYSMSNKALAADCLVWAAKSMKAEGQVPKGEYLIPLREAVEKFPGTPGAAEAEKLLKEWGA